MDGGEVDLDKISLYREDEGGQYSIFMTKFVPCVAGLKLWTSDAQKTTLLSSIVTPSDEALTILLLMNSIARWQEMHKFEVEKKKLESEGMGGAGDKVSRWSLLCVLLFMADENQLAHFFAVFGWQQGSSNCW
jgi:hypothetical protein